MAVFDVRRGRTESPGETMSNGYSSAAPSPEPLHYFSHLHPQQPIGGEIEVNEAILKASMSHLLKTIPLCILELEVSASSHEHFKKFNIAVPGDISNTLYCTAGVLVLVSAEISTTDELKRRPINTFSCAGEKMYRVETAGDVCV